MKNRIAWVRYVCIVVILAAVSSLPVSGIKLGVLDRVLTPQMMKVYGNELFVVEKYKIYIYSLPDLILKKVIGKEGEGPGELKVRPSRSIIISVNRDFIIAESRYKVIFYTRSGDYVREVKKPGGILQVMPLEENYAVHKLVYEQGGKNYFALSLYSKDFKEIRELFRQKFFQFQNDLYPLPDGIFFAVENGKLFVEKSPLGFMIEMYDAGGGQLKTISREFQKIPVSLQARKEAMADYLKIPFLRRLKTERGEAALNEFLNRQKFIYPDFFPAIRYMAADSNKIYVKTYGVRDGMEEMLVLDLSGKLKKRLWLTRAQKTDFLVRLQGDKNFFAIADNCYYYLKLEEFDEDEAWTVHLMDIK